MRVSRPNIAALGRRPSGQPGPARGAWIEIAVDGVGPGSSLILIALTLALALGCGSVPRVAASGNVGGYPIHGPVDHDLASDYLEGRPLPSPLQALRQRYVSAGEVPSRDVLASISREYSPDVATLLFLETLATRPEVRRLQAGFERELAVVRRLGVARARPVPPDDMLILMVPGWFYVAHGRETNGDFAIQRRLYEHWGIAHRLVETDENGTVEANARIVANAVREASRDHHVFVVSVSKSGAEVALALGQELAPTEADRVVGWLSIVGAVRGSPLADRVLESRLCWFVEAKLAREGFGLDGLRSMRASRARPEFRTLRFPPHIKIFSLIAAPLSGHVSRRGSFGYRRMRDSGPNDGLTLLADELIPGAVVLAIPGVDHFLEPSDQRLWSTAIFRALLAELPPEAKR